MRGAIELVAFLVLAFGFSALLAYFLVGRRRKPLPKPDLNATLRLRGTGGVYRSKLLEIDEDAWTISCPLSRNNYVPLRVGDKLTVEAPLPNGVMVFRTEVCGRDDEQHHTYLTQPENANVTDRRQSKRRKVRMEAELEGDSAQIIDVAPLGARIVTNRACHIGERVRIRVGEALIYGWVLDFWPARMTETYRESVRVRFEEIVDL